ncbi:MAG: type effector Hrp-dependent outer protein [Bryobacterales bacterium]|nr:type effector Hrp-dependent outer protein [Bryobacterales bacterium]
MTDRLFSFYGDDFTGSTDALEALASNGIPSVLFLDPPDENLLARFAHCRAIGIAGESRSRGPAWMDEHLPSIFSSLQNYGAPLCQYKVCSTFDSSPEFGSIGRALEIGQNIFGSPWVPIAVAAPHLKRYVLFGNLFAAACGAVHRIDRHPTMGIHPVTPMHEPDLRLHLARQTNRRIALHDILALEPGSADARLDALLSDKPDAILFDGLLEGSLREVGRLIWTRGASFCVGSSGLTHALILHWRHAGLIPPDFHPASGNPAERLIVVSGSCSPVTEAQIRWAMRHGFTGLRVDGTGDVASVLAAALGELQHGRNIILYSALGPADCTGTPRGEELGSWLGSLLLDLVRRSGVRRVAIAGGDTSTHAVRQLGMKALTFAGMLSPGSPLCRGYSSDRTVDGLELVLKGGQVGPDNFFEIVQKGKE